MKIFFKNKKWNSDVVFLIKVFFENNNNNNILALSKTKNFCFHKKSANVFKEKREKKTGSVIEIFLTKFIFT